MTNLRDRIAETEGGRRNGLASDGRGWYRAEADRQECYAIADALLPVVEAEVARVRTQVAAEIAEEIEALPGVHVAGEPVCVYQHVAVNIARRHGRGSS